MESEDDIPASQPVTTHPPPSAKLAPDRRKKRKKLSLSSRKHKSVIVRSKRDEPSTSKDVNNTDSKSLHAICIIHEKKTKKKQTKRFFCRSEQQKNKYLSWTRRIGAGLQSIVHSKRL